MASIDKRKHGYRVRWRDPDGQPHCRSCPDNATARKLKLEVERCVAEGRRWEPRDVHEVPALEEMLKAYLRDYARRHEAGSALQMAQAFDVFLRWLRSRQGQRQCQLQPGLLSKVLLSEWYDSLATGGLSGRGRGLSTRKRLVQRLEAAWAWAADEDEYAEFVPRPRKLQMPSGATDPTVAPTWEEMDRCIAAADGWFKRLAIVLRYTGLRVQQAMRLQWSDVDLDRGILVIRGELGKTRQEKGGRVVPLSPHLIQELAGWGRREGWLVPSHRTGKHQRVARQRDMRRAWQRAKVREIVWNRHSHHSFRKGFISGLKRLGADDEAVEFLVGHSLGLRGVYTDPDALPLREAVNKVPPIGPSTKVLSFDAARAEAVARGSDGSTPEDAGEGVREGLVCPPRVHDRVIGW